MVIASEYDAEGALAELFDDLKSVAQVFVIADDVLLLVTVKAMIGRFVVLAIGVASWQRLVSLILDSFLNVEEVDRVILLDLLPLHFPEVGTQVH